MRPMIPLLMLALALGSCRAAPRPAATGVPRYQLATVTAGLKAPEGLAVGPDGVVLATAEGLLVLGPEGQLRDISPTGRPLAGPIGVALATGSTFVADPPTNRIWRLIADAPPEPFAGTGTAMLPLGDGGLAVSAQLNAPRDVAIDAEGNLFIADTGNHRIRRVDPDGRITTVAGDGMARLLDGVARQASLNRPASLDLAPDGTLYIADSGNHAIRRLGRDGRLTTIAGTGQAGFGGDGGPAATSQLASPSGLVVLASGDLLVADTGNRRIRWIRPGGAIQTVAGTGKAGTTDEADATASDLDRPQALALAPDGTPFFVDTAAGRLYQLRTAKDAAASATASL